MKKWLRNKLTLAETYEQPRPSLHDDFEMSVRVEEALAATEAAARIAAANAEEARRLFGAIRREIAITKRAGEVPEE